jgi:NAD(P)-dependent dehydrogenase (short-subunit alcohol dehydrogenase family)
MADLAGKTALVTGASIGIGRAIALRLANAGARVAVHYNTHRGSAEDTVAEIESAGGEAIAVGADLKHTAEIEALFQALDRHGFDPLDILVNNAGIGLGGSLADTAEADFDRVIATNVKGPFFVAQAALPRLRDGGAIVNISSMVSVTAYASCIAYALSKAALNSFTRSLAADLGPRRIRVNAVAPGGTDTDFTGGALKTPQLIQILEGMTAFGRVGQPDDIAAVVEFLVSPGGAWITGQVIQASGGMHL